MDHESRSPHIKWKQYSSEEFKKKSPYSEAGAGVITQPDSHVSEPLLQNVSTSGSNSSTTLKGTEPSLRKSMQPPGRSPMERLHPPIIPHPINGSSGFRDSTSLSHAADVNENHFSSIPLAPEPPPYRNTSMKLKRMKGPLRTPYHEKLPTYSINSATQIQSQTESVKQKTRTSFISSLSASIKQALFRFPLRKKEETKDEDTETEILYNDTNFRGQDLPESSHTRNGTGVRSPLSWSRLGTKETRRLTSNPPISILSNASSCYGKPRLPLSILTTPLTALEKFQCTFCLLQCAGKTDWLRHEQIYHLEDLENFHRPYEHNTSLTSHILDETASSRSNSSKGKSPRRLLRKSISRLRSSASLSPSPIPPTPPPQSTHSLLSDSNYSNPLSERPQTNIFWNCGFCDQLLSSWDDRQTHLAAHFSAGQTMRMWDPMKSPFPWRKGAPEPMDAPPHWDLPSLLALQRPTLQDCINQIGTTAGEHEQCATTTTTAATAAVGADTCNECRVPHPSLAHFDLWHQPRNTYTCPKISGFTNLAAYFDEEEDEEGGEGIVDWCRACDERVERARGYMDREARVRHLWEVHGFGDCVGWENCSSEAQFILHLANAHAVNIEFIRGLVRRCRREGCAPADLVGEEP
ncbi:hypothetical protein AJ79_00328 [Helicocarpus griseus UAMH5409]|uniref:C2H2-type domain-containing protein n=1 Tax=Helicocarpus griseus UAMH5409 TaxID=1447875 RepID=A0A2B7YBT1_9EURO|nr:hypothetical protein AJ79_00328 [Helicocarpus griseus UAMH5409]